MVIQQRQDVQLIIHITHAPRRIMISGGCLIKGGNHDGYSA